MEFFQSVWSINMNMMDLVTSHSTVRAHAVRPRMPACLHAFMPSHRAHPKHPKHLLGIHFNPNPFSI